MKTYYKGTLFCEILPTTIKFGEIEQSSYNGYSFEFNQLKINSQEINYTDNDRIIDFIGRNYNAIAFAIGVDVPTGLTEIIDRIIMEPEMYVEYEYQEIIYEKIEDIHGNLYGKELISGLIFPIYQNKQARTKYIIRKPGSAYMIGEYRLLIQKEYKPTAMDKCYCMIHSEEIADNNEISSYQTMFDKGICRQRKKQNFIETIKELYNKNVFNQEITPKIEEILRIKETQNIGTTVMENIEYLLTKISKINKEKYIEYKKQYETILENENLLVTSLASLEGKLEFYLMFNKKGIDNIIDYLETLKLEYLENNINQANIDTQINLDDIDKIEELFLKSKNDYSLVSQRKILKDIAFIYLMEVYENIENIPTELLRRSYFISNLKTILIVIESLRELRLIENNIIIDLNTDITLDNILHIIRRIKFNNETKESIPTLIKKL